MFTCGDFNADTYDTVVWHKLEIMCQLMLPASLGKESEMATLLLLRELRCRSRSTHRF